jgi:glycogen(starch) synthase
MREAAPIRVLMTADAVGGVWNYALNLARAAADRAQFVIATMGPRPSESQRFEAGLLPNVTLECSDFALEWMPDPWVDVDEAGEWLLELEARYTPEIIHLNGYAHATLPFQAPTIVVGHSCCLSWWSAVKGAPRPPFLAEYFRRVSQGIACADKFIAPTQEALETYRAHYPYIPAAQVIHNGVPAPLSASASKEPLIVCAGRAWDEAKNIGVVDEAAPEIPWPVHFAGSLRGPVAEALPPPALTCLGPLSSSALHALLDRASVYVHPALYEPFGLLPVEAALHRCALVLSDIPTMRELWDGAALFFDPHDAMHLARTLRGLVSHPAQLASTARRAHARAQRYSLIRFGESYLGLYRSLIAGNKPLCARPSSITRS